MTRIQNESDGKGKEEEEEEEKKKTEENVANIVGERANRTKINNKFEDMRYNISNDRPQPPSI